MHKAYKFRIYPTKEQEILINKTIGCTRFVYNYFLAMWDKAYKVTGKGLTAAKCDKLLTDLKKHTDWLREVDKFPLQQAIRDLGEASHKQRSITQRKPLSERSDKKES